MALCCKGNCHADSLWCLQDVNSHSFLVRLYYQKRIFMGFCCVSCEVLYLMVSLSSVDASVLDVGMQPALITSLMHGQSK